MYSWLWMNIQSCKFSFEGLIKSSQISFIFLCISVTWIPIYLHANFIVILFYIYLLGFSSLASQVVLVVKFLPANAGDTRDKVRSLGWEDPLEEEMATHSNILAWEIPWTEDPGELQSMELQRVWLNWAHTHSSQMLVNRHHEVGKFWLESSKRLLTLVLYPRSWRAAEQLLRELLYQEHPLITSLPAGSKDSGQRHIQWLFSLDFLILLEMMLQETHIKGPSHCLVFNSCLTLLRPHGL